MSRAEKEKVVCGDDVKQAIRLLQSAKTSAWLLFSYSNATALKVVGSGQGDSLEEAVKLLSATEVSYLLLRREQRVELANTVKTALITFCPPTVKPLRRSIIATHTGQIRSFCYPITFSLDVTTKEEITEEAVMKELGLISGTSSRVTTKTTTATTTTAPKAEEKKEDKAAEKEKIQETTTTKVEEKTQDNVTTTTTTTETVTETKVSATPTVSESRVAPAPRPASKFVMNDSSSMPYDEKTLTPALKNIRNDNSSVNWVLTSFQNKRLENVKSGTGGVEELAKALDSENPCFGLVRIIEMIDNKSKTTKFVHVRAIPSNTKLTIKAQLTGKSGAIEKLFQPFLLSTTVEKSEELTQKGVEEAVANASGSKSHIIQRS
eukprot:TRINITY_DN7505_c0_g1_i1.p1 TRINITY_DN7505_c0_g1~~TRINITY_DN7505_c0_g1_i1.p1  ORF type:complete len:378 (-),score=132.74 TRINITY_DN7505_c0_g1_i1:132-1265(-)